MFEQYTESFILNRMKQGIDNGIDTTEGTFTHAVLSPSANEVARIYSQMNYAIKQAFLADAEGDYLTKKASEFNTWRKDQQKAVGKVTFYAPVGTMIPNNTIVSTINGYQYATIETGQVAAGQISVDITVQALKFGTAYNIDAYKINKLNTSITGVTKVENKEPFVGGDDTETDEHLRERAFDAIKEPSASGNAKHYKQWCYEVNGVGAVKVIPIWNGPGTVKVIILDSNSNLANTALIEETAKYIETKRPIGATVTVVTGVNKNVDIAVQIQQNTSVLWDDVKAAMESRINDYLLKNAFYKEAVSYNKIVSIFEDLCKEDLIADYKNVTINGGTMGTPLVLASNEVPVLERIDVSDF